MDELNKAKARYNKARKADNSLHVRELMNKHRTRIHNIIFYEKSKWQLHSEIAYEKPAHGSGDEVEMQFSYKTYNQ